MTGSVSYISCNTWSGPGERVVKVAQAILSDLLVSSRMWGFRHYTESHRFREFLRMATETRQRSLL
jgi:hypothetical protein